MKKISFIVHGKTRNLKAIITDLKNAFSGDYNIDFCTTSYPQDSIQLAKAAAEGGATHIICVGGDGSINEVTNGVILAQEAGISVQPLRIGLLPSGTGNDFAKTMHISADPEKLKKYIDADQYRIIDLASAEFINPGGKSSIRYFINITDIGMGGVIAQKLTKYSKWMGSNLTFQRAIISTLISYKRQRVNVQADNFVYNGEVMNVVFANGKYFGSGMGIAPDAVPDDGVLSTVIVGKISLLDYLKLLGQVRKCRLLKHPEIKYFSSTEVSVDSPDGPLPIDMDGEFVGYSPLKIKIVPKALNLISPV